MLNLASRREMIDETFAKKPARVGAGPQGMCRRRQILGKALSSGRHVIRFAVRFRFRYVERIFQPIESRRALEAVSPRSPLRGAATLLAARLAG